MSTELFIRKIPGGFLPADGYSSEVMDELKPGTVYKVEIKASRNYKFLQKAFVLVRFAFDIFSPNEVFKGEVVKKNIDDFRDDLTILAGFYTVHPKVGGGVRLSAKSWSFKEMPDDKDFLKLYSSLLNVVISKICTEYTGKDLDHIVNSIISNFG